MKAATFYPGLCTSD